MNSGTLDMAHATVSDLEVTKALKIEKLELKVDELKLDNAYLEKCNADLEHKNRHQAELIEDYKNKLKAITVIAGANV